MTSPRTWLTLACIAFSATSAIAQEALPVGAVARLGVPRMRTDGRIHDAVFTQDGRTFAIACDMPNATSGVVLFDVATGLERKRLMGAGADRIAMARDKTLMAVAAPGHVEIWDLSTEKRVKQWPIQSWGGKTQAIAFSADGAHVVAAGESNNKGVLERWDAATGKSTWKVVLDSGRFGTVRLSSDGRKVVATTFITDFDAGTFNPFYTAPAEAFLNAAETPMFWLGNLGGIKGLAAYNAYLLGYELHRPMPTITTWDAHTGKKQGSFLNVALDAVIAPDGSTIARRTRRYDAEIWRIGTEPKHLGGFYGYDVCEFTPDSKHLVYATEGYAHRDGKSFHAWNISLWDIAARQESQGFTLHVMPRQLRVSADGKVAAVLYEDPGVERHWFVEFFDLTTGKQIHFPHGHPGAVEGLAFAPDGKRLATCSRDTLVLHDVKTGAELRRWIGHQAWIRRIAFSPDGKVLVSAAIDGSLALWNAVTGAKRMRMTAKEAVAALAFTPDGKSLLTATQDSVGWLEQWDLATGKAGAVRALPHDGATTETALSASGQWLGYFERRNFDGPKPQLHLWPIRSGEPIPPRDKTNEWGSTLGTPRPKGVRVLELLRHPHEVEYEGTKAWGFTFSADGKLLATSDSHAKGGQYHDHAVRVWETATQREILRFGDLANETALLAIAPDGRTVARGVGATRVRGSHVDEAVALHDLSAFAGGGRVSDRTLRGHRGAVTCVAFSPDSRFAATGGSDGVVYIWQVDQLVQRHPEPEWKKDVAALWPALADPDPAKALRALARLETQPDKAVKLVRAQLKPAAKLDETVLAQHLRDLANANFAVRQQASAALEDAGAPAIPLLQQAMKQSASLEVKRRIEALLDQIDRPLEKPNRIRAYRVLMLLERIATPDARKLLEELAQGDPSAWLSVEAKQSLDRLR